MMQIVDLHLGGDGAGQPCVLSWTGVCSSGEARQVLTLPLLAREGGFLCALPADLHPEVAAESEAPLPSTILGPSRLVTVPAIEEDENGEEVPAGLDISVMLLDLEVGALAAMRPFDPVTETGTAHAFVTDAPHFVPQHSALISQARTWIEQETVERLAFYSAQEDEPPAPFPKKAAAKAKRLTVNQLAEQVSSLTSKCGSPSTFSPHGYMPKACSSATVCGPERARGANAKGDFAYGSHKARCSSRPGLCSRPYRGSPRRRPLLWAAALASGLACSPPHPMQTALLQQSQALSTLVGHLVSQQDGGLADLSSSPGVIGIGAKGAAKREKLQAALAARSGDFFLQVMQTAFRRLNPSAPCPSSLEDLSGQVSMCHYLERFGGYGGHRETGYIMWCLAHVADCLVQQDILGAQEFLALTLVALDQSVIDHSRCKFACMDFDAVGRPSGPAFPCQASQLEPTFQGLFPLISGGLDNLCPSST